MQLPGVNQMQINAKAGVTFASGLRSILRQDPERDPGRRDPRSGDRGHRARGRADRPSGPQHAAHQRRAGDASRGCSTWASQPFLVASSLLGIVAQRLRATAVSGVRGAPAAERRGDREGRRCVAAAGRWPVGRRAADATQCGQSGLKGRIAIHEVLEVNDEMRDLISKRASEHAIKKAAREAGMRTLLEDGIEKAAQGLTTLEEVLRVVSRAMRADRSDPPSHRRKHRAAAGQRSRSSRRRAAPRGRVLVVEDSPTIVSVVKYFLELEGFEVLVAEDGVGGLEMAFREPPDVIVSDVNMPGMGGVAMVKALRADPRTAHSAS